MNASYESLYGPIESNWKKGENGLSWKVVIPANTTASIRIPAASADKVTESGKPLLQNPAVKSVNAADGFVVVEAGSGTFDFLAGKCLRTEKQKTPPDRTAGFFVPAFPFGRSNA